MTTAETGWEERLRQPSRKGVSLLTASEKEQISEEVLHEVFGLGPLEPLLQDNTISDILVNGYSQVYVERAGMLEVTNVRFHDNAHLLRIIDRIVSQVGRRVDESNPMVDARLLDGSRVNAIIPPLAVDGPLLSIRRFGNDRLMPADLVDRLSLTAGMMRLLEAAVRARLNIIVSGGTGAGKTTLLNGLSAFISPRERIVTIEDAAELQLKQPHLARLETRPANVEGHGMVRQRQLLINALRMRPDRIIVGEVRGEEALDMLQAMNTGHDGSLTTVHANSPRDAISRLEVMVSLANANMHLTAIRQQIASAVHILVQISRMSDGTRRVMNITEVTGMETDVVCLQDIFVFEKLGLSPGGKVMGRFAATGILPKFNEKLVAAGIRLPVDLFDEIVMVEPS
jgi:pilus assembly protein CpaF